jgi:GNAT superfamily N-acetyltransferase
MEILKPGTIVHYSPLEQIKPDYKVQNHVITLSGESGTEIGTTGLIYIGSPIPTYYIANFDIYRGFRGRGSGGLLLESVNGFLKAKGKAGLLLNIILNSKPEFDFYERHGWQPVEDKDCWFSYNIPANASAFTLNKTIERIENFK